MSVTPGAGLLGVDVVFPALHGPFGEDGTVQGLLETLDVAYVGSGVAASAVCIDKVLFKELMSARGVPQVDYVGVREDRFRRPRGEVLERDRASSACRCSSSRRTWAPRWGSSRSTEHERMLEALEQAFAHDELVIVEAMAHGRGGRVRRARASPARASAGRPRALASEPGEIVFAGDWYDFDAKYTAGGMELRVPARISRRCARAGAGARAARRSLRAGCDGLARVDFFVDGERVLVNELNTMPGFTPTSVYAKLMAASGIAYPQLVDRLCRLALERHARERATPDRVLRHGALLEQRQFGDRRRLHVGRQRGDPEQVVAEAARPGVSGMRSPSRT